MNKEDILAMSRRENKNHDLAEQEIHAKACAIAGCVGALVCCAISVMAHLILGDYLLSPWVIYFSIMGTQSVVRYVRLKRRSDLAAAILLLMACVVNFAALIIRMLEVAV